MKNQKNERGITLVALVVTIVVLLILAGITIIYVMQGDSVFSTARESKTKTNDAVAEEVVSTLVISDLQVQLYTGLGPDGQASSALKQITAADTGDTNKTAAQDYVVKSLKSAGMVDPTVTFTSYSVTSGIAFTATFKYKDVDYEATVNTKAAEGTKPIDVHVATTPGA